MKTRTMIIGMKNVFLIYLLVAWGISEAKSNQSYHSQHASAPINFRMTVIDPHASGTYGLIGQDINGDGYTDLVSFAYSGTTAGQTEGEIYWYEFQAGDSKWKKHLIVKKKHALHGAFMDVNNDGFEDLVFTTDFEVPIRSETKEGNIWWAERPKNLEAPEWKTYWIGRSPGAHRIIAADVAGTGTKKIVVVPLFGPGKPPIYGPTSISLYVPNANPTLPWKKVVFANAKFHAIHDAVVVPKTNGKKGQNVLIAAKEGVLMLSFSEENGRWKMDTTALHGSPEDSTTDTTARDKGIAVLGLKQPADGNLSGITALANFNAKASFIAAIDYTAHSGLLADEPWHGDTVSLYLPQKGKGLFSANGLERKVLEKRAAGGHAIQVADFNGDGCLDVVAGFRAYPTGLVLYLCKKNKEVNGQAETHYEKQIISERSANAIVIGNWNKNGLPALATVGYGNEGDPDILMWTPLSPSA